jgi:FkbM family methyltransferase
MGINGGSNFTAALVRELLKNVNHYYGKDNWDSFRFGTYRSSYREMIIAYLNKLLFPQKIALIPINSDCYENCLDSLRNNIEKLSSTYSQMEDDYSKSLFINILVYRMLGYRKVKLPLSQEGYWFKKRAFVHSLIKERKTIQISMNNWILNCFRLNQIGFPIELFSTPDGILITFILRQYEYQKKKPGVLAQRGDYVIDAGGGWGDTALYFAHQVESDGRVYTFEFIPSNVEIIKQNLELNPGLMSQIDIIPHPLWEQSDVTLFSYDNGPGSMVTKESRGNSDIRISTMSIDDFVKRDGVPKVNFIKMDVEGAELSALKGAAETIKKYKPKLAIAVYHNLNDLVQIPKFLSDLNSGYKFYLDHFTIHSEETILFCITS